MVDLVGDFSRSLVVPRDESTVGWVSAHTVRACYEVWATSQKQDVQGLLDTCFINLHHLEHTHTHAKKKKKLKPPLAHLVQVEFLLKLNMYIFFNGKSKFLVLFSLMNNVILSFVIYESRINVLYIKQMIEPITSKWLQVHSTSNPERDQKNYCWLIRMSKNLW